MFYNQRFFFNLTKWDYFFSIICCWHFADTCKINKSCSTAIFLSCLKILTNAIAIGYFVLKVI